MRAADVPTVVLGPSERVRYVTNGVSTISAGPDRRWGMAVCGCQLCSHAATLNGGKLRSVLEADGTVRLEAAGSRYSKVDHRLYVVTVGSRWGVAWGKSCEEVARRYSQHLYGQLRVGVRVRLATAEDVARAVGWDRPVRVVLEGPVGKRMAKLVAGWESAGVPVQLALEVAA